VQPEQLRLLAPEKVATGPGPAKGYHIRADVDKTRIALRQPYDVETNERRSVQCVSSRRSPLHKFIIQKITKPAPEVRQPADAESLSVAQQLALETGARSLPLPSPRAGGWLSRLTGRKPVSSRSVPPPGASEDRQADTTPPVAAHSMDEYNWNGFSCPYCSAAGFVSCSGGHLACDGTAKLRDGRRFHQCFCGRAGFISGTIKTVESRRLSVEADVGSRSEGPEPTKTATSRSDVALLAKLGPTQSGPPAKR
jgi:hypothetical protein